MFVPTPAQQAQHWSERQVDFGGYQYHQYFKPSSPHYRQLPQKPEPAANYATGERCMCRSCVSEGWYAQPPICRFWRSDCYLCVGRREYPDRAASGAGYTLRSCEVCEHEWVQAVRFFRDALRSPRGASRRLRRNHG